MHAMAECLQPLAFKYTMTYNGLQSLLWNCIKKLYVVIKNLISTDLAIVTINLLIALHVFKKSYSHIYQNA